MTVFLVSYLRTHRVSVHKMQAPGAEPIWWPLCSCKWNDAPSKTPATTFTDEHAANSVGEQHLEWVPFDIGALHLRRIWFDG